MFRASRDGWTISDLVRGCGNMGLSVTLIKTSTGRVFGVFAYLLAYAHQSITWNGCMDNCLFTLEEGKFQKYQTLNNQGNQQQFDRKQFQPGFGMLGQGQLIQDEDLCLGT